MIFKAYDIRGIVPAELDPDIAYGIGRATAHYLEADPIAVGRDARTHSPELAEALIDGIRDEGAAVVDLGLISTPMLYFAVDQLDASGGVMVTASHNPGQYNGFKLCREHAIPVGEASGLKEIEALCSARARAPAVSPRGTLGVEAVVDAYVEHVLAIGSSRPKLKVAIDCGNGMAGRALVPLLERLPLEVERLYFEPDGRFPNHEADPLKRENLEDLVQAVRRSGADFGVAFDGDGDRACFVDEQGEPISSDLITALLARYQLKRSPRGRVLYDLRSSRVVAEEIGKAGGQAEMCRVGHSFVKAQMRESGAIFAGELSGHFYFRFSKTLVADDGTAAFVAMLDVLADRGEPLSKIVAPLRRYAASGEINLRVDDVSRVLKKIESEHEDAAEISKLDGLLVRYPEWWFNLRPSNTEPVLRLNLEADTPERMANERDLLLARIEELGSRGRS
ncbi:MAG: phosphomannomutase/phosphoglucomutase [Myxococcota bacterium]|nr:phosphomannomutase/phosphoglucomutase [Myxococcota bacterium]